MLPGSLHLPYRTCAQPIAPVSAVCTPQIKSIWSVMLRNFDFEMLDPVPAPDYDSMVIGPKPARIRYTRRKLTA
jgi:hypothetical protein